MAIETNTADTAAPGAGATFSGTTLNESSAPGGSMDFLSLSSRVGINRIDSTVEPYLEKVMKLVKDALPSTSLIRMDRSSNSYAVQYAGPDGTLNFFGIVFVSMSDPVSQKFLPASGRIAGLYEEIKERFADKSIRLADARVIIGGYAPDMDRADQMADCIVRTLQVTSDPVVKNAQITALTTNEFVADWRLPEARTAERQLSPHGVAPRMDIGLTIKAKIRNDYGRREFQEFNDDYRMLGVIGGYTEIREKEVVQEGNQRVLRYIPIFHITVCNAVIPLEGVAAILVAALARTIYNTRFWAKQWQDLSDGQPNPGMLEPDPDNRGRPIVLKDQDELLEFINAYFATPAIVFDFQDGRDNIPGMLRMASTDGSVKSHFVNRLTNFFATAQEDATNVVIAKNIGIRFDGAYGDPSGLLHDSRDIDYLRVAATNGFGSINQDMRRILLGGYDNPTDRARLTQEITGVNSFAPLWLDTVAIINPAFVDWIGEKTRARNLVIVDPNSHMESRPIGSFIDGFGSASNVGSIITNGINNRGLNLSSVWFN